ncbi:MAG: hypothetical protein H6907_17295 [Hyphomicrobiales bacterium]|nr:hypothetical protein [Hyphomicrobiales bacterium]
MAPKYLTACLLAALTVLAAPSHPARAYEGEHFAWTYYLALQVGFTERQAFQIASGAYAIDWDPHTGPMPDGMFGNVQGAAAATPPRLRRMWSKFHAFGDHERFKAALDKMGEMGRFNKFGGFEDKYRPEVVAAKEAQQQRLWDAGVAAGNPGPFIHFLQDRFSHDGWYDLFGHGAASHFPDYLSLDPDAAWKMTEATVAKLAEFRAALCANKPRPRFCRRKVGKPSMTRIRQIFGRLVAANPLPRQVENPKELIRQLKQFSLTYDYLAPLQTPAGGRGLEEIPHGLRFFGNAARSGAGVQLSLWRNGAEASAPDWLVGMPGPSLPRVVDVVREAVRADKEQDTGGGGFFPSAELRAHVQNLAASNRFSPDLPYDWLPFAFDDEGRIAARQTDYRVEDLGIKIGEYETSATPVGPGPNSPVKVGLTLPVKVTGMANLNFTNDKQAAVDFMPRLPAVISALVGDPYADKVTVKRDFLDGKGSIFRAEIEMSRDDYSSGKFYWDVAIDVYGQERGSIWVPIVRPPNPFLADDLKHFKPEFEHRGGSRMTFLKRGSAETLDVIADMGNKGLGNLEYAHAYVVIFHKSYRYSGGENGAEFEWRSARQNGSKEHGCPECAVLRDEEGAIVSQRVFKGGMAVEIDSVHLYRDHVIKVQLIGSGTKIVEPGKSPVYKRPDIPAVRRWVEAQLPRGKAAVDDKLARDPLSAPLSAR